MTEQEAYAKGLEKLGLQATFNDLLLDVRRDPAFAWRVLEAMLKAGWTFDWDRFSLEVFMVIDPSGVTLGRWDNSLSAADALYAAVCALGREVLTDEGTPTADLARMPPSSPPTTLSG